MLAHRPSSVTREAGPERASATHSFSIAPSPHCPIAPLQGCSPVQIATFPDSPRPKWRRVIAALGNFDGLHRGHMKLIEQVRPAGRRAVGTPVAMIFEPHPPRVLRPDKAPPLLMTIDQKIEGFERAGLRGRRRRPVHARSVTVGTRDVCRDGARSTGWAFPKSGSGRIFCSAAIARARSRCSGRSAKIEGSAPRRSIRSGTRTSSCRARASGT